MKKMFLLGMLLTASMSFAQLKRVQTTPSESIGKAQQFGAPLEAEITKSGNVYTVSYRDMQFKTINEYRSFSFEDVDNTFNDLYAAIEEGFNTMPAEPMMLELPNHYVWLDFKKFLGYPVLTISSSYNKTKDSPIYFSNEIAKKQIEKLFGKRN
jgi:hypothetical protein